MRTGSSICRRSRPGSWRSSFWCCRGMIVDRRARCCCACRWRPSSALVGAVLDRGGLVPSLDHRDRRHQFAGRAQDRLHQAPTFEMSLDKVESVDVNQSILGRILDYGDVTITGVGEGRGDASKPSPRRWRSAMPSPRDRAGASPWPCNQILPSRIRASRRSIPPKSRSSQNCRTSGGTPTARWRRCTRSIRCG